MTPKIVVVGCGVVGAMIAYELSTRFNADIAVIESAQPAQGSTGAALGVLMGIISHKVKGRTWRLREASIRRYPALISELASIGHPVSYNSDGLISLCFDAGKLAKWETLRETRQQQGWPLEIWSPVELQERCPQVNLKNPQSEESVQAAIYSPTDSQVHPADLTRSLVAAAQSQGVRVLTETTVKRLILDQQRCVEVEISHKSKTQILTADWVILSAGLGSAQLASSAISSTDTAFKLMPVLGQAMKIQLPEQLGKDNFQPVINGHDIHIVPLPNEPEKNCYWVGATVEFPPENIDWAHPNTILTAEEKGLENLQRGAIQFMPAIAQASVLETWSGLRPRPVGQPAPVIQPLNALTNVMLATGHYRNGVLLAPATAQQVCQWLEDEVPMARR